MADATAAHSTFQQEWLWRSLERYRNWGHLLYAYALRVCGEFDAERFRQCLTELTLRHPVLRSQLVMQGQALLQLVAPHCDAWQTVYVRAGEARSLVESFFDGMTRPEAAGLFEVKILSLSNREHVVAIAIHHIISDATSISLMFRELWSLYVGCILKPPAAARYVDYAQWQRKTWRHDVYWDKCLHEAPRLQLPYEPAAELGVKEFAVVIDEPLAQRVRVYARQKKSLLAMVMFAAYVAVVARWCGARDLLVPFATAGRHLPEHEQMVGFFSYYLYVRIRIESDVSYSSLLESVTRRCYEALSHQDFARGLEQMPELAGNPSFNWVSVSEEETCGLPSPEIRARLGDAITVEPFEFQRTLQQGIDPLQRYAGIVLWDTGTAFRGKFYLCPGRAQTAGQFLDDYQEAIQTLIAEPESSLFVS
jgi:hypothetical protein